MSRTARSVRRWLYPLLVVAFLVRIDVWFWDDPSLFLGLPIGLTYHALYTLLLIALLAALVRFAWPFPEAGHDSPESDRGAL